MSLNCSMLRPTSYQGSTCRERFRLAMECRRMWTHRIGGRSLGMFSGPNNLLPDLIIRPWPHHQIKKAIKNHLKKTIKQIPLFMNPLSNHHIVVKSQALPKITQQKVNASGNEDFSKSFPNNSTTNLAKPQWDFSNILSGCPTPPWWGSNSRAPRFGSPRSSPRPPHWTQFAPAQIWNMYTVNLPFF